MKKLFTKVKNYFKSKTTRSAWLIGAWMIESAILINSVYLLIGLGSTFMACGLLAIHMYGSYALFSLLFENHKLA
jgi:hypothetical protein